MSSPQLSGGNGLASYPQLPVQGYYVQPGYVFLLRNEYDKLLEAKHTLGAIIALLNEGSSENYILLQHIRALVA